MKCKKKYATGGVVGGGDDPKKKKAKKKVSSATSTGVNFNETIGGGSRNKTKGSCEDGNLRACKSEVAKTPKFSAKKKRHNLKLVKAKPEKEEKLTKEQKEAAKNRRPANPRFL